MGSACSCQHSLLVGLHSGSLHAAGSPADTAQQQAQRGAAACRTERAGTMHGAGTAQGLPAAHVVVPCVHFCPCHRIRQSCGQAPAATSSQGRLAVA